MWAKQLESVEKSKKIAQWLQVACLRFRSINFLGYLLPMALGFPGNAQDNEVSLWMGASTVGLKESQSSKRSQRVRRQNYNPTYVSHFLMLRKL